MFSIEEIDSMVEKSIFSLELKGEPQELYNPIEYLISIGGKRVRPKLAITTFNLFSDQIERSIFFPAIALEVFHGFTLIHDDIMDNASMRRNQPTVHKKWNNNIAILSGDVMCIKSYQYIAEAPVDKLKSVMDLFTSTAAKVCEGQQFDMNFESTPFITMDDYLKMIGLKTAELIAASAKLGAILAGTSKFIEDAFYNYGYALGMAFQIKDDYFDSFGESALFGKNIGGDILCGKKTWLMVEALKRAKTDQKAELEKLLKSGTIDPEEKISAVLSLYNDLGIKEAAQEAMSSYHKEAIGYIKECDLTNEQKDRLSEVADNLINRKK